MRPIRIFTPYALLVLLGVALMVTSITALQTLQEDLDTLASRHAHALSETERLRYLSERVGRAARSYLLTGVPRFLEEDQQARQEFRDLSAALVEGLVAPRARPHLLKAQELELRTERAMDRAVELKVAGQPVPVMSAALESEVQPLRDSLNGELDGLVAAEEQYFTQAYEQAARAASRKLRQLIAEAGGSFLIAIALAALLARTLRIYSRQQHQLESVNLDLDAFAGRVAHDLKNVLSPIPMEVAHLRQLVGQPSDIARLFDRLDRSAQRSRRLIDTLLAFSQGTLVADVGEATQVTDTIHDVLEDLRVSIGESDIDVQLDAEPTRVRCSRTLLHTVLLNLMGNSVKYLDGQARRVLKVSSHPKGRAGEIIVEDSGPGFPESFQARIFDPFFRVPGSHRPGTGIGLATVKRIVDSYGGTIVARSKPGEGASFIVSLPLDYSDVHDEAPRQLPH